MNNNKKIKYEIINTKKSITNNNDNKTLISGSMGLVILKNEKLNKTVYLFYDDHSNNNYCSINKKTNTENYNFLLKVYKLLEKKHKNILFLLEEPFISDMSNLAFMWEESVHVEDLRNFYIDSVEKCSLSGICNSFPVDIRLCLFELSIEELINNINNLEYFDDLDYFTPNYFKHILFLFNIIDEKEYIKLSLINDKNFSSEIENIESTERIFFLRKVFNMFTKIEYYIKLKNKVEDFYLKYIKPNTNTLLYDFVKNNSKIEYTFDYGFPFTTTNYTNMLDNLDHITCGVLEFYVVILTNYLVNNLIVINCGFYHGLTISYILSNYFGYDVKYKTGITEVKQITNNEKYKNCIVIDNKYL